LVHQPSMKANVGAIPRLLKSLKLISTARVTESNDLYLTQSLGNCSTKVVLMVQMVLFRGAKIQCSDNQATFI